MFCTSWFVPSPPYEFSIFTSSLPAHTFQPMSFGVGHRINKAFGGRSRASSKMLRASGNRIPGTHTWLLLSKLSLYAFISQSATNRKSLEVTG